MGIPKVDFRLSACLAKIHKGMVHAGIADIQASVAVTVPKRTDLPNVTFRTNQPVDQEMTMIYSIILAVSFSRPYCVLQFGFAIRTL